MMRVDTLRLRAWRNYTEAAVDFAPGINVVTGANAQGKTNLLEAVYLLSAGRSFRTRFDRELIAFSADAARVEADTYAAGRAQTVEITLRRGGRKQIWRNRVRCAAGELSDGVRCVLFCPDDLNLIREGAAARRRLLDNAISQLRPGYARLIADYTRACENKLRILRDYREDPAMLSTLDDFSDVMARLGAKIIRYRAAYVRRLAAAAARIHGEFTGGRESLSAAYATVSTVSGPADYAVAPSHAICAHQERHRAAELASGSCLTGVHKDDLLIEIDGRSARSFASQGQTRTAALCLKLAEREIFRTELGESPVLLLDDVLSELDERRQSFVLNRLEDGQTLITCCEGEDISQRTGGRVILVEGGGIR